MDDAYICLTFKELGLVMCKAETKRKVKSSVWDKMHLESVSVFYRMGYVFRNKANPKKYYTEGEIEEMIKSHIEKTN